MSNEIASAYKYPLNDINWQFSNYLKGKKSAHSKHVIGHNIMDYAYSVDLELRKTLDSIPGLLNIAQNICSTKAAKLMHQANHMWLAVGPNQFPEIYQAGCECAKTLGIGIPNIYITNDETFNAYACGSDDIEPFIIIGNLLLKRFPLNELKSIIGHECGHIQNAHIAYDALATSILNVGTGLASALVNQLSAVLTTGAVMTLKMWSRACEVTADRAGLICSETPDDIYKQLAKFMYAAVDLEGKVDTELDLDTLKAQMEESINNPSHVIEIFASHPMTIKRIFAGMEFAQSDVFYNWRPDLKKPGQFVRSKAETDKRCKKYIDVIRKKEK